VPAEPQPACAGLVEEGFLRECLRAWDAGFQPGAPPPRPAPPPNLDPEAFISLVRRHGVAHATMLGLAAPGAPAPAAILQALERLLLEIRSVNVLHVDRLGRVAVCLEEAGVEFLALKGAALLGLLYRDPAERPMTDLDLLIRRADLGRALAALAAAGVQVPEGGERRFWEESYHHIALRMGRELGVNVELHWDLELRERYPFPLDRVWKEAVPYEVAGRRLRTLAPHWHFVFGAIHLARHFYAPRLVWLIDQRRMARQWKLDWAEVGNLAASCRALTPLWFVGAWEERIFGATSLPQALRPAPGGLKRRLFRALDGGRPITPFRDVEEERRRIFATLLFFDRASDLARFLWVHGRRKLAQWSGLEARRRAGR
jgi:hypothetical protein